MFNLRASIAVTFFDVHFYILLDSLKVLLIFISYSIRSEVHFLDKKMISQKNCWFSFFSKLSLVIHFKKTSLISGIVVVLSHKLYLLVTTLNILFL